MCPSKRSKSDSPIDAIRADYDDPLQVQRLKINTAWLIHLRLAAVIGQFLTIVFVTGLGITLPLIPLSVILCITAATNGVFVAWERTRRRAQDWESWAPLGNRILAAIMLLDLLSLTGLLYFTGGTRNPFVVFYLVNVALSAVLLSADWAWRIVVVAIGCLGFLSFFHVPLPVLEPSAAKTPESAVESTWLLRAGLWVSYGACAGVIVNFITRVTAALRKSQQQVRIADRRQANLEKVESLATLSAGAAHELATPLSTISVVVAELQRELGGPTPYEFVDEDLELIRAELDRCRSILDQMAGKAGEIANEGLSRTTAEEIVEEVLDGVRRRDAVVVEFEADAQTQVCRVPLHGLAQAIRRLVQNALDASEQSDQVRIAVRTDGDVLEVEVQDHGTGIPAEVLARVGEPFFTTKSPGGGMGLGVFLARNVIERLGGSLTLASTPGRETTATVVIPLESAMATGSS